MPAWLRPRLERDLDTLTSAHATRGTLSGAVLVAQQGRVLFRQAYGLANAELGVANTAETAFRLGSVAKTFTALTVARLIEAGRIALDDYVAKFVPDWPAGDRIRIDHLLSNASGIPDYLLLEEFQARSAVPHDLPAILSYIRDRPLLFAPGAKLSYSNSNWALLAVIVERVADEAFPAALDRWLLAPLTLRHTYVEIGSELRAGRAGGYSLEDGRLLNARYLDPSVEIGAGGLRSTLDDLYRLDRALGESRIWKRATLEQMATPVARDETVAYGLGFFISERFGKRTVGHSGGTLGFTAFFTRYPDDDAVVIVLSNIENGSAEQVERDAAAILFGRPYQLPADRPVVAVDPALLATYEATYRSQFAGRPINFKVVLRDGSLYAEFPLLPKARLEPLSERQFATRLKGSEVVFEFVAAADRRIGHIAVDWSGIPMECPRLD